MEEGTKTLNKKVKIGVIAIAILLVGFFGLKFIFFDVANEKNFFENLEPLELAENNPQYKIPDSYVLELNSQKRYNPNNNYSVAIYETNKPFEEVIQYYRSQLENDGWVISNEQKSAFSHLIHANSENGAISIYIEQEWIDGIKADGTYVEEINRDIKSTVKIDLKPNQ